MGRFAGSVGRKGGSLGRYAGSVGRKGGSLGRYAGSYEVMVAHWEEMLARIEDMETP